MKKQMHHILKQNTEIWNIFTGKEEYFSKKPDKHNRIIYDTNNKNVMEPTVSKFLIENGFNIEYPENKKFAICLTHDVDDIYPPFLHTFYSSLYSIKNLNFFELKNHLFWHNKGKEFSPYCNIKEIIKLEERYNAKSSFYLIATDKDIKRFRYNIEDLKNELGFIIDRGWEVGLHGGYYAYNNLNEIKKEKKRLEKSAGNKIIGYRNHYLRFKTPDTWELLEEAGFKYDTTFGYNNTVGFRNGMCHPFKPFNMNSSKELHILEIPLIIMDVALFNSRTDCSDIWKITKNLIDTVEKYNGVLTILWHNDVFNCPFRNKWQKLYEKILIYSNQKNGWMTSGEDIYRWWNENVN